MSRVARALELESRATQQIHDFPDAGRQRGMSDVKPDRQFLQTRLRAAHRGLLVLQYPLDIPQYFTQ
jgi:hypothetical protein